MATQQTDTSSAEQGAGAIPPNTGPAGSVQDPIGVPYYIIDPRTGQPALGPDGQPLRWGVSQTVTPTGPGSYGTQGPGTAPSSGGIYVLPKYFSGDEWLPASLPPDQVASLQHRMVAAGLLKSGEAQLGVWDMASVSAYQKLLAYANASGFDAQTALDRWGTAHAADPNVGRAPLTVQTTNPDDAAKAIRSGFINTLGIGISQDHALALAAEYNRLESGAQKQAYDAQDTGGTVAAPPSLQTFAENKARESDPTGAQEHDFLGAVDQFRQMVGGWQG